MLSGKEKHINYRGTDIYYQVSGAGKPVMLLHGFGEDHTVWQDQIAALHDVCLILPDIPGSGRSAPLAQQAAGMEDFADCINQVLEAESIGRCTLIGHSMGGYICLAFAEKYEQKLSAFGLFHSSAYPDDESKKEARKKAIAFIEKNGPAAFLETSIPGLFFDTLKSKQPISQLLKKGNKFSGKSLIQYYEAMIARPDRTAVLQHSRLPVLLIMGQHDKAVPFLSSLEQASMPQHAYVHILRQSAHMGMLEEPHLANTFLADFLHMPEI